MQLLLIRHGRSLGDDEDRIEGAGWDAPLTAEGIRQARLLTDRLRREDYSCDILFASPLARAKGVADIVAAGLGVPVTVDVRVQEIDTGALGGLGYAEAAQAYPEPEGGSRAYVPFPGGESKTAMTGRVLEFYSELVDRHMNKSVCVVAHGGPISTLLQVIYGMPLWSPLRNRPFFGFRTGDTGVHKLAIERDHVITYFLNDTSHLRG